MTKCKQQHWLPFISRSLRLWSRLH